MIETISRSYSNELIGPTNITTDIPVRSLIYHIDILQSGTNSNSWFECGGMILAKNYAKDAEINLAFTSTTTCSIHKTGADEAFFTIQYIPENATTTNFLSADKTADVFFYAIIIFIAMLWWFRNYFDVKRYE